MCIWDVNNKIEDQVQPLVTIETEEVVWCLETEENRMVGLSGESDVSCALPLPQHHK